MPKSEAESSVDDAFFPQVIRPKIANPRDVLRRRSFRGAHLVEANGEEVVFDGCDFSFSVIERSYFKKAHFKSCSFTGSKIIWSNFRGCRFENCDFKYAAIERTVLEPHTALASLPAEPNLRREWLQQLRANAVSLGRSRDVGMYIDKELAAEREHWRLARLRSDGYYHKKYGSISQRIRVYAASIGLWLDHAVWGHGESLLRLLASTAIAVLALAATLMPSLAFNTYQEFIHASKESLALTWLLFIDSPSFNATIAQAKPIWASLVLVLRYLSIGLFVAIIFRKASWR